MTLDDHICGRAAVSLGHITAAQLKECMHELHADQSGRSLAQVLLARGLIADGALAEIARIQRRKRARHVRRRVGEDEETRLGSLLVARGLLTLDAMEGAVLVKQRMARKHVRVHIGEVLVERGAIDARVLRRMLREQRGDIRRCRQCDLNYHVAAGVSESRMCCPRCRRKLEAVGHMYLVEADGELK